MKSQHIIFIILVCLAITGGAFYGGLQYAKANVKPGQANQLVRMQGQGMRGGQGMPGGVGANRNMGGFTVGEVLSKDANSLVIKLSDGGSKIVFFSASTTVSKMADGSMEDVVQGTNIMITGSSNQDGSVTAKTLQLRPKMEMPVKQQ